MLEMHHVIALLQLCKINVQERTRSLGMRRFEPARALHFVTAENLGIGHDHQFGRLAKEAAGQSAEMQFRQKLGLFSKPIFAPNLLEALPLALVVAKDVHRPALAQPAVDLAEEIAPLHLGDLRLGHLRSKRPKGLQALELEFSAGRSFPYSLGGRLIAL